jgi:hypothetical protein
MSRRGRVVFTAVLLATVLAATPVLADWCLQLNGGPFSGDLGFFRFRGGLPKKAGKIVQLTGRAAGLSPAFGAATVAKDGSNVEVAVTFFADAVQGQFDIWLWGPGFLSGDGYGSYGVYGVSSSVNASVVTCRGEP